MAGKRSHLFSFLAFLLCLAFSSEQCFSQHLKGGRYDRGKNARRATSNRLKANKTDVFPLDRIYKLGGPSVAAGITYMWPGSSSSGSSQFNDTSHSFSADPSGKVGLYGEISWFHSFVNPAWVHYVDAGISYKQVKGQETFTGTISDATNEIIREEKRTFSDQFLSGHFNATNHWHFSRYGFINNSIGVNVEYNIGKSRSNGLANPSEKQTFPEDIFGQLHYKFGVGWKAAPQLLVVPSIETPILTVFPFDDLKSTLPYFNSRYRPIIVSIRFLFIRKDPENCKTPNLKGPPQVD